MKKFSILVLLTWLVSILLVGVNANKLRVQNQIESIELYNDLEKELKNDRVLQKYYGDSYIDESGELVVTTIFYDRAVMTKYHNLASTLNIDAVIS